MILVGCSPPRNKTFNVETFNVQTFNVQTFNVE